MAKFVPFRSCEVDGFNSRWVFDRALEQAPVGGSGMGPSDFHKRSRVWRALDNTAADGVALEDADWETLRAAVKGLRVQQAPRSVQELIVAVDNDLDNAKDPAAPTAG